MCEDFVQCVPTKKGHQILFKGYSYVFKAKLQCGSEQWCCSYRQKTVVADEETLPEWVSIYYVKNSEKEYRCNICEVTLITDTEKSLGLLEHIKTNHNEVYELHKENPEANMGFRIEFLQLNVEHDGDPKQQPVILGEVCEAATEEIVLAGSSEKDTIEQQIVLVPKTRKTKSKQASLDKSDTRKRSWVWKYFHRMSSIIFRCTLCNVVLSIKGCNTNNMNRHVRSRHPKVYKAECLMKGAPSMEPIEPDFTEVETPIAVKTEEICSERDYDDPFETPTSARQRRSWIWLYFNRVTSTCAQCRLCHRNISHGGNATGNMNRHLKMIHHKTGDDNTWVWKVFENSEDDFYTCKLCQYQCMKFSDLDKSLSCILGHLKDEHGVVSGDQIITGNDIEDENC